MRDYFNKKTAKMYLYCKKEKTAVCEWLTAGVSSGTKKDAELIGPLIKHKNNAEPKNKLGPASRWCGQGDLNPHEVTLTTPSK